MFYHTAKFNAFLQTRAFEYDVIPLFKLEYYILMILSFQNNDTDLKVERLLNTFINLTFFLQIDMSLATRSKTETKSNKKSPEIRSDMRQNYVQNPKDKSVKLKVGGRATIYEGTKVKIRCPVKRFDRYE